MFLCVFKGETGLGKSTLMDTLFNTKFEGEPTQHNQPGVQLKSNTYELQESNVRLKLTVVNTVGFGDQINKEDRLDNLVVIVGHKQTKASSKVMGEPSVNIPLGRVMYTFDMVIRDACYLLELL